MWYCTRHRRPGTTGIRRSCRRPRLTGPPAGEPPDALWPGAGGTDAVGGRCIAGDPFGLGQLLQPSHEAAPCGENDEITAIARFIAGEMNRNAHGEDARRIRELNEFSAEECIADWQDLPWWQQLLGPGADECVRRELSCRIAALLAWAAKVRQDGDWDHKPIIRSRFTPRRQDAQQVWHLCGNVEFYYDIWSNIHYGYVGTACGFSRGVLLDGAGLEQIGSTFLRDAEMPERSEDVSGLRAYDDPSDRASITIGIRLYEETPSGVTARQILQRVRSNPDLTTQPYSQPQ